MKIKKLLLATIFISGLQVQQPTKANILESVQEVAQKAAFAVFESAINAGLGYAAAWMTVLVHEMGHAVAYSALYGKFGHINMGFRTNDKNNKKPLISLPGLSIYNFYLYGTFNPNNNLDTPPQISNYIKNYSSLKDWSRSFNLKYSIFSAAGPLAHMGMSVAFLRWFAMHPFIQAGFIYGFLTGILSLMPACDPATNLYTDGFLMIGSPKLSQSTLQNLMAIFRFMYVTLRTKIIPSLFALIHLIKNILPPGYLFEFAILIDSEIFSNWVISTYPNDINERSIIGWTALHLAVRYDKKNIVELLLQHGADSNIKDNSGWTATDYARGKPEIFQLIESHKRKQES